MPPSPSQPPALGRTPAPSSLSARDRPRDRPSDRPLGPFHGGPTDARPRLLLLSYHFPPSQAVGALRWQQMARHLAERGWALDIITLPPEALPAPDMARLDDLPPGTRVWGVPERALWMERLERLIASSRHALAVTVAGWRDRTLGTPAAREGDNGQRAAAGAHGATRARRAAMVGASLGAPAAASVRREEITFPRTTRDVVRAYNAWRIVARQDAWAAAAARTAVDLARSTPYRAVLTCGPPHMVHRRGARLAHALGLPFVMDLRDPWSLVERLPAHMASPVWFWLAQRHERRAVRSAALVVANTEPARAALAAAHPDAPARILAVLNGHDDEPLPMPPTGRRFIIAYAGTIYLDRDPRLLLRAAHRVIEGLQLSPDDFGIEMVGNVDSYGGEPVTSLAREEGVADYITLGPLLPRAQLFPFLARAAMLVSLPQDSDMAIPSKIFEYVRFPAWLLALSTPSSATARVLAGSGADIVAPDDVEAIAQVIRARCLEFWTTGRPRPIGADGRFSRRAQAHRLVDALEAVLGAPASAPRLVESPVTRV